MGQPPPLANIHRQPHDRIIRRLAMHFRQHRVGFGFREIAAALDRRQLRRIAQHERLLAEGEQVAAHLLVHHRTFVDDDEIGLGRRTVLVEHEGRRVALGVLRPVDHAVDRARVAAPLGAHHERGLAGECAERDLAVHMVREMARERRLARAREAEQAEDLRLAGIGKPARHLFESAILRRGEIHQMSIGLGERAEFEAGHSISAEGRGQHARFPLPRRSRKGGR